MSLSDSKRRSKRSRHTFPREIDDNKTSLQLNLEHAIQIPGGIRRTLDVLRTASDADVAALPQDWSPLVGPIVLVGSTYTRRRGSRIPNGLVSNLVDLIDACRDRGLSVDGGSTCVGSQFHRPLVVAAYYGFATIVEHLLDLGAKPDLADGEGRTAFHAALQNPAGQNHVLRECDEAVARMLFERGTVTPDLRRWRDAPAGSIIYAQGDSMLGSAMLASIRNKNVDAVRLLRECGAVVTDRDFLCLYKRNLKNRLVFVVSKMMGMGGDTKIKLSRKTMASWSPEVEWSFPPTWKVAIALCRCCGLPQDIFRDFVVPYCSRDWFFTTHQLNGQTPPRLGASMGGERRNLFARSVPWKQSHSSEVQ